MTAPAPATDAAIAEMEKALAKARSEYGNNYLFALCQVLLSRASASLPTVIDADGADPAPAEDAR